MRSQRIDCGVARSSPADQIVALAVEGKRHLDGEEQPISDQGVTVSVNVPLLIA